MPRALADGGLSAVTVAIGHDAERIADALSGLPVAFAFNPNLLAGQMSSVRAGLMSNGAAHGDMIAPADVPELHPERVERVEAPSAAFVSDIDTPDAYTARPARTGPKLVCRH